MTFASIREGAGPPRPKSPPASSLRVCLVSAAYRPFPSGVAEHVHHLAGALRRRGHTVSILSTVYPGDGVDEPGVTRLGRVLILPANRSRFTLPVGRRMPSEVRNFLARGEFDVIHCHGIFPPEISYWAALHARAPVVVTFHTFGLRLPGIISSGFRGLFRGLRRKVQARIAVSRAGRTWAEEWFPGDYHVIPNGVDLERFHPDAGPPPGRARGVPYLLFVGRLEQRKGLEVLLRALPPVFTRFPDYRLVVVGSGPLEKRCRLLARKLGIDGQVEFVGRVDAESLPGWYAGSKLFVSPALGGEAMGIVLIEAMACARPVVASCIAGYDEVVTDGINGLLTPPGDPAALAATLLGLLAEPQRAAELATAGREHAQTYAWPRIAERVEAVYREVAH